MKQSLLQKQILVDGKPACKLSQNVDTGLQQITFQGKQVSGPAHHYYMLNKPAGAVTANRDAEKLTVLDLLDKEVEKENLYSIGRLDRDTEGLLLITDNGPLGFQLLHPQYHVEKTYYVEVNGPLTSQKKNFLSRRHSLFRRHRLSACPAFYPLYQLQSEPYYRQDF